MKNKKTTYFIIGICTFIISFSLVAALNGVKDTYAATTADSTGCYACGNSQGVTYTWYTQGSTLGSSCSSTVQSSYTSQAMCEAQNLSAACYYCSDTNKYEWGKLSYRTRCSKQNNFNTESVCLQLNNAVGNPTYTITFNPNGGSFSDGTSTNTTKSVELNETFTFPYVSRSGYKFKGWSNGGGYYASGATSSAVTSNTTYLAFWLKKYTVSYDANNGTGAPSSQEKIESENLTLSSTTPTRTGYTFLGWGTSSNTTTVSYKPGETYSNDADITLYAVWNANNYKVTFHKTEEDDGYMAKTVKYNEKIDEPSAPALTGYTFAGWYTTATGGTKIVFPLAVTKNMDIYAHWTINTYTISYNLNSGSYGTNHPSSATYNSNVSISNPTKSGYTFTGWKIAGMDSVIHTYGSATTIATSISSTKATTFKNLRSTSGTVTFTAQWTPNSSNSGSSGSGSSSGDSSSGTTDKTVYAYYDFNGGTLASGNNYSQCTISGTATSCSVTPPTPTREGYTFSGYRKSGETSCKTGNLVLTQNTNYQACWDKSVTEEESSSDSTGTYKALYEPEGGTVENNKTYDECTVSEGETSCKITLPLSEKEGYEFNGWRKSGETTCQTGEVSLTQTTRFFACYSSDKIDVPIEDIPIGDIIDKINEEIENNSKTGDILIFICWVVGIGAIAFATYYYHYHKKEI